MEVTIAIIRERIGVSHLFSPIVHIWNERAIKFNEIREYNIYNSSCVLIVDLSSSQNYNLESVICIIASKYIYYIYLETILQLHTNVLRAFVRFYRRIK